MKRLLRFIDVMAAAAVVFLSFVHTFAFGSLHIGAPTQAEVWFAGAGAAMFFAGAMNLVRWHDRSRLLAALCALACLIMIALVLCFGAAIGSFGPWQVVVQLGLYAVLLVFSMGDALRKADE